MARLLGLDFTTLRSRIARRVLLLFAVLAMLPLLSLSWLGHQQLRSILVEHAHEDLQGITRAFGLNLYSWLKEQEKHFRLIAVPGEMRPDIHQRWAESIFSQLDSFQPGDTERQWLNGSASLTLSQSQQAHLQLDGTALISELREGVPRVHLAYLDNSAEQPRLTVARLHNGQLLEQLQSTPPAGVTLCIANQRRELLMCSDDELRIQGSARQSTAQDEHGVSNQFTLQIDGSDYVGASWSLFTRARFGVANWEVVAVRPASDIFQAAETFGSFFAKATLATMLLAVLLSITQIRKYLDPIQQLIQGTKRLSKLRFDKPVQVNSGDELEELADAFNGLSSQLQHQFTAFDYLNRVGEHSLVSNELGTLHRLATEGLCQGLPAVCALVISFRRDDGRWIEGLCYDTASHSHSEYRCDSLDQEQLRKLAATARTPAQLSADELDGHWAELKKHGLDQLLMANVSGDSHQITLLAAGLPASEQDGQSRLLQFLSFCDRLTAALKSASQARRLHNMAYRDELTGLLNKHAMAVRIQSALPQWQQNGTRTALILIDLDRFKQINDSLGHRHGDEVLGLVAERLRQQLPANAWLSRYGGDEFTVMLPELSNSETPLDIAHKLLQTIAQPVDIHGHRRHIGASIGVAHFPEDGESYESLLKAADTAMYETKREQLGGCRRYNPSTARNIARSIELENELRLACESDQLYSLYQPKVDFATGLPVGAEALMRWQHPQLGAISPMEFIPVAEDSGQIITIGLCMQAHVCQQFSRILKDAESPLRLSVNVSPVQLAQSDYVDNTLRDLERSGFDPNQLEIEITESTMLQDTQTLVQKLTQLREAGIGVAIDDFGTGYSSLSYLHKIPATALKIDQSFIRRIGDQGEDSELAHAIITMAHSLGLEVVAEGVETEAQFRLLAELGCDIAQGYYFSKPVSIEEITVFMHEQRRLARANWSRPKQA